MHEQLLSSLETKKSFSCELLQTDLYLRLLYETDMFLRVSLRGLAEGAALGVTLAEEAALGVTGLRLV